MKVFEDLGFERRHTKTDIEGGENTNYNMNDANGFYVDVCGADLKMLERDLTAIRMYVDDFDEAVQLLKDNGFRESKIVPQNYTPTSKYAYYVSPSGFVIDLIQHIKKEDK